MDGQGNRNRPSEDMYPELLTVILDYILLLFDYIRFGSVCRNWNVVAYDQENQRAIEAERRQPPMLFIPAPNGNCVGRLHANVRKNHDMEVRPVDVYLCLEDLRSLHAKYHERKKLSYTILKGKKVHTAGFLHGVNDLRPMKPKAPGMRRHHDCDVIQVYCERLCRLEKHLKRVPGKELIRRF